MLPVVAGHFCSVPESDLADLDVDTLETLLLSHLLRVPDEDTVPKRVVSL
jgi:hypothetical protein